MEIANRELDAGLYLALHFAKRGLPTIFGERMVSRYVQGANAPVIYIDIEQYAPINKKVLSDGGYVLNCNPEGFAFVKNAKFISTFDNIRGAVSDLCLWGDKQLEVVKKYLPEDMGDTLRVVGHPTFDLVNKRFIPYYRNESIVDSYGEDYILINTNFGVGNHAMGYANYTKMMKKMDEWKVFDDPDHIRHREKKGLYQEQAIGEFVRLVKQLSKNDPHRKVVLRPHPAENKDFYRQHFRDCPNVFVVSHGSVREWIATARAVIHHDCTTSIEALLMGKQVIQYRPVFDEKFIDPLLVSFGMVAENADQVEEFVQMQEMPLDIVDKQHELLRPFLANVTGSASERLGDMAKQYSAGTSESWIPEPLGLWGQIKCWRKHLSKVIRAKQPGRNGKKVSYALSKFPRLPLEVVQKKVEKLRAVEPSMPSVSIEQLALNTFLMRPID